MPLNDRPMLEVQKLCTSYGPVQVLHEVSLTINTGELVAIVGANGAGKTTLLHSISAVQKATSGSIFLDSVDISKRPPHWIVKAGVCHVPEGRQVFAPLNVEDNLQLGAYIHRKQQAVVTEGIEHIYEIFPILRDKRRQAAGTLSGGQQQMLALGRALMGQPKLMLLDEPSMGLAPLLVEEIFGIIKRLNRQGVTILLVEQNARAALGIADRGYVLETGNVVMSDTAAALLADDTISRAYLGG